MIPSFIGLEAPPGRPIFSLAELQAMHRYCLVYRDLARGGGTPTKDQDDKLMDYQKVCYGDEVTA